MRAARSLAPEPVDERPPHEQIRDDLEKEAIRRTAWARRRAQAARQRNSLVARYPEHVKQCWHNGGRAWWIYSWKVESPNRVRRAPYVCQSWRCPTCKRYDASVNFARIREAAEALPSDGWLFLTLTIERDGVKTWQEVDKIYKQLSRQCRNFLKRLKRWQQRMGMSDCVDSKWVGVVEAHRSGWPHLHLMIHSSDLARFVRFNPRLHDRLPPELEAHAVACGFGVVSSLEVARSSEAVAGYLTKLAGEMDQTTGELAKLTQLPIFAPVRFRRLRSGKGFLPPRRKNPEYTGTMLRRSVGDWGFAQVDPLHRQATSPLVIALCEWEEREWSRVCNRRVPDVPTTSILLVWQNGDNDGSGDCGHRGGGGAWGSEGVGLPRGAPEGLLDEREPATLRIIINAPPTI